MSLILSTAELRTLTERQHRTAASILFVLESLWKARMELAKLKEKR